MNRWLHKVAIAKDNQPTFTKDQFVLCGYLTKDGTTTLQPRSKKYQYKTTQVVDEDGYILNVHLYLTNQPITT